MWVQPTINGNMVKQIIMMVNHVSKAIVEHPQFYHEWVV